MANKNARKIFISLMIGVVVTCVSLHTFSNLQREIRQKDQLIQVMQLRDRQIESKKFSYLTATRDISAGETITENDIKKVAFATEQVDGIKDKETIIGNVLVQDIEAGNVFTGYAFTGANNTQEENPQGLRVGYRALTLSTTTLDGMSSDMKVGSLIDVFSKSKTNQFVLSKVKILSLTPAKADSKVENLSITDAKSATFEVPINKIQDLVEIYSSGKILLVMRPVGDDTVIVGKKKETEKKASTPKNHYTKQNYNYDSPILPKLPVVQTFEDITINEVPAPVVPKKKTKTVEIIEASNKTEVSFD